MRPVDQTTFGGEGNCVSACIASILEAPIEEVPFFFGPPDVGWLRAHTWLWRRGLHLLQVDTRADWIVCGYMVLEGPSPRGLGHAVVGYAGVMTHDPHPSRGGLVSVESARVLVPLDIAAYRQKGNGP